jgi:hypothetical protein
MEGSVLNPVEIDKALDAFKAEYERLTHAGVDPNVVVVAMSEIIAFALAHRAVTGGGAEETLRVYRRAFESAYRDHVMHLNKSQQPV